MKILITLIVLFVGYLGLTFNTGFDRSSIRSSDTTENISNMRSVLTGLLGYYAYNEKKFPETLQQLIDEDLLEQEQLKLVDRRIYYISGLDAFKDGEKIIIYSPAGKSPTDENQNALVGFADGRVEKITTAELNKLLEAQNFTHHEIETTANPSKKEPEHY